MLNKLKLAISLAAVMLCYGALADDLAVPSDWITIDAGKAFTFRAPPDTAPYSDGGIAVDSFVGMYRNSDFTLMFDYGLYSNNLRGYRSMPGYSSEETEIDGRPALIVTGPGGDSCDYKSAVYLVVSHSWWSGRSIRLMMNGCTKNRENLPMLHKVFHSLRFSES